jgi:pimeloyl-ACP methyl ester carboxylesterase
MPFALVDGIRTSYELGGSGPPVLMFAPGGFNATIENWRTFGIYARLNLLDHLAEGYTYITFDKRESGQSGGRVERIGWNDYAAQGLGLLDELGVERAHVMGGCIGCSIAAAMAVARPERVASLVLYSPAGGPRYRLTQQARFAEHLAFVAQHGLAEVVLLASGEEKTFAQDPRVGPWASVIRTDAGFAEEYARQDSAAYPETVGDMARTLFDRDTVPGPEPEQLLALDVPALVVPGNDPNHALSAARYLEECLPRAEYWDVPPEAQTEETAPARVLDFLLEAQSSDSPRSSAAI